MTGRGDRFLLGDKFLGSMSVFFCGGVTLSLCIYSKMLFLLSTAPFEKNKYICQTLVFYIASIPKLKAA